VDCTEEAQGAAAPTPVQRHGKLRVSGTDLVDQNGAVVQLKGPSSMWLNWETAGFAYNCRGIKYLRDGWNATVVRAAMGVEPAGGYLTNPLAAKTAAKNVVSAAVAMGLYVIVDWHDHAAHNHRDQAIAFFQEMAETYRGVPNVLYEIYNEPTRASWATGIKPYHEAVVAEIRAREPDAVIILGTPNWSQYVDEAAADPVAGTNLMYTMHFYSCTHTAWLRERGDAALALGAPLFVTEWGATHSDGGTAMNPGLCLEEAQVWHDWLNGHQISWAAWKLDDCTDGSCFFRTGTSPSPPAGGWPDSSLNGHGPFVRDRMRE
jgi:endoglucanase